MKSFLLIFASLLLIHSCKKGNETIEIPNDFDGKVIIDIFKNPKETFLTKVSEISGINSDKILISEEYESPNISQRSLLFSWPNGQSKSITTLDGKKEQLEAYSSLGIGFLRKISKENFSKQFESEDFIKQQIENISQSETIDSDIAILEIKNMALNAKTRKVEKLENVGELSYWEKSNHALHVFANGIAFTITTNMETEEKSKDAALEMVKMILTSKS